MNNHDAFCPHCGARASAGERFCTACGGDMGAPVGANGLPAGVLAAPASPEPARPRRRGRARRLLIALVALFALAFLGLAGCAVYLGVTTGRWDLIPAMALSALRHGPSNRLNPAAREPSGTPAVDVEPYPGFRIKAAADAMDKPREFKIAPLDTATLAAFDRRLRNGGLISLGGYRFDAGMKAEEQFHEPVTVTLDLAKLGIPADLREDVALVHADDAGNMNVMVGDLRGGKLTCRTRHNASLLPILIPLLLGVIDYAWEAEQEEVPKGEFAALNWKPEKLRYIILYPKSWPPRNPDEVKRAEDTFRAILAKYKLTDADMKIKPKEKKKRTGVDIDLDPFSDIKDLGDQISDRCERLAAMAKDPDYRELRSKLRDETWLLENYLPIKVGHAIRCLDRGYDYLGSRNFRKPGIMGVEIAPNVFIVDTSLGAETYGEERNTWTTSPYLVLDGTKIPGMDAASFDAAAKHAFDALQTTALHEMFHVVQSSYALYDFNSELWFREATAVMLEVESKDYFTQPPRSFADSWDLTVRSYDAFFDPMDVLFADEAKPNQQHGYGEAYFLEFLRDYYYPFGTGKENFLPELFEDYAGFRGGAIKSLYRTTGKTPESLSNVFYKFSYSAADDIHSAFLGLDPKHRASVRTTITAKQPVYQWGFFTTNRKLSAQILEVNIPQWSTPSTPKPSDPVFGVFTNGLEQHKVFTRLRKVRTGTTGKDDWREISGCEALPRERQVFLMRAETYVEIPEEIDRGFNDTRVMGPVVFGLFPPPEAPEVTIEKGMVRVEWPPARFAKLLNRNDEPMLISGYIATFVFPDGATLAFRNREPRMEVAVEELIKVMEKQKRAAKSKLFGLLKQFKQADIATVIDIVDAWNDNQAPKLKVRYQEVAVGGGLVGPPSPAAEFELGDEQRLDYAISGRWMGTVPFTGGFTVRFDLVGIAGNDFIGTYFAGTDEVPIKGHWRPVSRSWTMDMRGDNIWYPMPGLLTKLPGNRIYSHAPPCLLRRGDREVPKLGWKPEPQDMTLKQLLWLLGNEAKELEQKNKGQPQAP